MDSVEFIFFYFEKKFKFVYSSVEDILENYSVRGLDVKVLFRDWKVDISYENSMALMGVLEAYLEKGDIDPLINDYIFSFFSTAKRLIGLTKGKKFPKVYEVYTVMRNENLHLLNEFQKATAKKEMGTFDWDINGDVVVRFPPEPSGYLHIGHSKAAILNSYLRDIGKGKMIVRFDDTNQEKGSTFYEKIILEDLKMIGISNFIVSHTSDYFPILIELGLSLMKKGLAYCDNTQKEKMREMRDEGIPSLNRNLPIEENLKIFEEMRKGKLPEYCVRAKIDYKNPNKALRDPVIFRHIETEHPRVKNIFLFPTYDFSCPLVDSLEGVTHTLRTNEYRDRNPQYEWFLKSLEMKNIPKIYDFSRLKLEDTIISKRKLRKLIEEGSVKGWNDPRMPTIRGLIRKGLTMSALKEYIILQGNSQKSSIASWDKIYALNKKIIEKNSDRYSCVGLNDFVEVKILTEKNTKENREENSMEKIKNLTLENNLTRQKNNEGVSLLSVDQMEENIAPKEIIIPCKDGIRERKIYLDHIIVSMSDFNALCIDEEFTLMNYGNAIVKSKSESLEIVLNLEGDFKKTKNKINFISKRNATLIRIEEYDELVVKGEITKPSIYYVLAESSIRNVKIGEIIQFERLGFYRCDSEGVFIMVPYTKQSKKK